MLRLLCCIVPAACNASRRSISACIASGRGILVYHNVHSLPSLTLHGQRQRRVDERRERSRSVLNHHGRPTCRPDIHDHPIRRQSRTQERQGRAGECETDEPHHDQRGPHLEHARRRLRQHHRVVERHEVAKILNAGLWGGFQTRPYETRATSSAALSQRVRSHSRRTTPATPVRWPWPRIHAIDRARACGRAMLCSS